jgi:hypothetical protein
MKIKVKKQTETFDEVEVKLPFYTKNGHYLNYKVISEDQALFVGNFSLAGYEVSLVSSERAFSEGYEQIDASEFEAIFDKVSNILNDLR